MSEGHQKRGNMEADIRLFPGKGEGKAVIFENFLRRETLKPIRAALY